MHSVNVAALGRWLDIVSVGGRGSDFVAALSEDVISATASYDHIYMESL